tara:strand:- start:870 stop:1295 length:426 start_codon:yes stop_codon:yes gene_type:complete
MAHYIKPTLTLTSTGGSSGVSEDASLALSVGSPSTSGLSVTDPMIGISRIACTTTGNETIILPDLDTTRYVYIKNTGLTAADAGIATGVTIKVEIANNTRIINLAKDEWCFFPHKAENSGLIQLEASADTVIAEYGYWTKA